jgi:hypothetical protein
LLIDVLVSFSRLKPGDPELLLGVEDYYDTVT